MKNLQGKRLAICILQQILKFHRHSEFDNVVSVENSRMLYEKLTATQHETCYYELEGNHAHGGITFYDDKVLDIV